MTPSHCSCLCLGVPVMLVFLSVSLSAAQLAIKCESRNKPCGCPSLLPKPSTQKEADALTRIASMATRETTDYYFIDDMAFRKSHLRQASDVAGGQPVDDLVEAFWPGGIIFYLIDRTFSEAYQSSILKAMKNIENSVTKDHLEFRLARTSDGKTCRRSYIYVKRTTEIKCEAEVGMQKEMRTHVWLNQDVCTEEGVIIHELLHALGRYHEHCRSDRDKWIEFHPDEIVASACENFYKLENFFKRPDPTLAINYDVQSIMHYDSCAFSCRGKPTMLERGMVNSQEIKLNRKFMTALDVEKLRVMFPRDAKVPYRDDFCRIADDDKKNDATRQRPGNCRFGIFFMSFGLYLVVRWLH